MNRQVEWFECKEVFDPVSRTTVQVPIGPHCKLDGLNMEVFPLLSQEHISENLARNAQFSVMWTVPVQAWRGP